MPKRKKSSRGFFRSKGFIALIVLVVVIAAAAPFVFQRLIDRGSESYIAEAKSYAEGGDIAAAIIQLKNAVRDDPDDPDTRLMLGKAYLQTRQYADAEKELRAALSRGSTAPELAANLARAYYHQGKFDEILNDIASGDRGAEIESQILSFRGHAYRGKEEYEKSEESFRKALELTPGDTLANFGLAVLFQIQREHEKAEAAVDEVLAVDAESIEALNLKGQLRRRAGDTDGALEQFDAALAVNANSLAANLGRAAILVARGKDDEAKGNIDVVLARQPKHPVANYLVAVKHARAGENQEAINTLQRSAEFLRNYPAGLLLMAYLNTRENQMEQAEQHLRTAMGLVPENLAVRKLLANVYLRKGTPDKAIGLLQPVADQGSEDLQLLSLLANAYLRDRKPAEAAQLLERIAAVQPDNAQLATQLALSRLQTGQSDEAVADLEQILETDPDATQAGILLVLTHLRENRLDDAEIAAADLKTSMGDSPLPDNLLGGISLRRQDLAAARQNFNSALEIDSRFVPAHLNLAQIDLAEGKVEDAKARYEQILTINGTNVAAMMALSRLAFQEQRAEDGVGWLDKAIEAQPRAVQPRLRLVDYHLSANDSSAALTVARAMVQEMADNPLAVDALGRAQFAAGQTASAVTAFRRVVSLAPNSPVARQRLAQVLVSTENFNDARETLERAIELAPRYVPAYLNLITLEVGQDNHDTALGVVEQLRKALPESPVADLALGDIKAEQGAYEEAIEAYNAGLEIEANSRIVARRYRARVNMGQRDVGFQELRDWLAANPEDDAIRFTLASDLLANGESDQAVVEHEKLLERQPNNNIVLNNLAWLYDKKGDPRGLEFAEKAHAGASQSPAIKDTLGWILLRNGQTERALTLLREAAETLPDNAEIQYHLAAALEKSGQRDQAKEILQRILTADANFAGMEDARELLDSLSGG